MAVYLCSTCGSEYESLLGDCSKCEKLDLFSSSKDILSPVHSEPITERESDARISFVEIGEEPIGAEYLEASIQQQETKKIESYSDYEALTPDELDERVKMAFINFFDRAADNYEMKQLGQSLLENDGVTALDAYSTYDIDTGNINLHLKFGIDKELF